MKKNLKIGLAQINSKVGDLQFNFSKISNLISLAKKHKVDLLCFPELALTGYPPEDLLLNKKFLKSIDTAVKNLEKITNGISVIVGYPRRIDKKLFNVAGVFVEGKLQKEYKKFHLPNYGVFDENRYFEKGVEPVTFTIHNHKIGITICEDIWVDTKVINERISDDAIDLLINLSASPFSLDKQKKRLHILKKISKKNRIGICYCNIIGGQDELVFDGRSMILDNSGNVVAYGKEFEEDLLIKNINFKQGRSSVCLSKKDNSHYLEKVLSALCLGLKDYVYKNNFSKVLLGISGGIDSALVTAIAVKALGKKNVLGIALPTQYSSDKSLNLAKELSRNLGFKLRVANIQGIFEGTNKLLTDTIYGKTAQDTTEENLQARIRANVLMATSNKLGHLLLCSGNKSEISIGYSTLYGDATGGLAILKDIPKTLVYKLARFYNQLSPDNLIPKEIILREPSAELKENQKDSDSLPPYGILDAILELYIEEGKSLKEISSALKISPLLVSAIIQKVNNSEFKRRQSPPGIKITAKAFGRDRRYPITNRFIDA
ncbi:MAG: NAD+ synthase [Spirochaetales bacterium]|nr:NAD+ synthase [Spirochaetales bacterium]|tara:strand:- start:1183 stop:2823 length:1641 start_codon:yes stop_codon:yes gene_type:complete